MKLNTENLYIQKIKHCENHRKRIKKLISHFKHFLCYDYCSILCLCGVKILVLFKIVITEDIHGKGTKSRVKITNTRDKMLKKAEQTSQIKT